MLLNIEKAFGIMLATTLVAGCNIGESPEGTAPKPEEPVLLTPIYSGGIYDGVIDGISGSGSNCAINGNFSGLIDEDGNAFLMDSNGCTLLSNNISVASLELTPNQSAQNFFPEITGNFDIFRSIGEVAEYSGAIVGGVSGPDNYCVSAAINGLNSSTQGTGAVVRTDPISHLWARAIVSNNSPLNTINDGICGELITTSDFANQVIGFYSEQVPGIAGGTLYKKPASFNLLNSRWIDYDNSITISIDETGAVNSLVGICDITGTISADNTDINVYSAELDFGTCPYTFSGKGWLSADNSTLTLIGTYIIDSEVVGSPVYNLERVTEIP